MALTSHAALRVAVRHLGAKCFIIAMMTLAAGKTDPEIKLTAKLVPQEYYDYLTVFSEIEACAFPPWCYGNHAIPLVDAGKLPFGRMYLMEDTDLKELNQWIEDNLSKSFTCASRSSIASLLIIVRKPGSAPHICINYRVLNDFTVKDWNPLPHIKETFN